MDITNPKINVTTRFDANIIEQSVWSEGRPDDIRQEMFRNIVRLQDQGIRDALIALGWTPPTLENKPSDQ